jgi:sphinganine C4-monooxygenase
MDTLSAGIAYKVSFMSPRMGMAFYVGSMIKTVDDHCGYKLPWDPLQHMTSNNAAYHDIHHQSWGIKTNFSQPFFTIWDRLLGTMYMGDTSLKYERARVKAATKEAAAQEKTKAT